MDKKGGAARPRRHGSLGGEFSPRRIVPRKTNRLNQSERSIGTKPSGLSGGAWSDPRRKARAQHPLSPKRNLGTELVFATVVESRHGSDARLTNTNTGFAMKKIEPFNAYCVRGTEADKPPGDAGLYPRLAARPPHPSDYEKNEAAELGTGTVSFPRHMAATHLAQFNRSNSAVGWLPPGLSA